MKRLTLIIFSLALCVGLFAPVADALAQSTATTTVTVGKTVQLAADPKESIGTCFDLTHFDFGNCMTWLVYYVPYTIGNWVLGLAARAFDVAASFTLSSKLYTAGTFLQQGWQIMRDFANIFFILILLFIALSLTLDMDIGHANPKKMLVTLVLVALVINFSFFITEVVIDISNSLALVFYNQVTVTSQAADGTTVASNAADDDLNKQLQTPGTGTNAQGKRISIQYIQNERPLSVALVKAMKPQLLSDQAFYNQLCSGGSSGFFTSPTVQAGKPAESTTVKNIGNATTCDSTSNSTMFIALFIIVGIMFLVVAYCFIVALVSLFGRMIGLFINIIFAPIAFVSLIVPKMSGMPGFGWDEWFSSLMTNAFAAPIFFFFILLISILSKSTIIPGSITALSPGVILILVVVQFLILTMMMLKATAYVKKASGEIGNALGGLAGGLMKTVGLAAGGLVLGAAAGTASGAVAVAGRETFGRAGKYIANSDRLTRWSTSNNSVARYIGKKAMGAGEATSKASFNAGGLIAGATGLKVMSMGPLSGKATAGGYQGKIDAKAKRDKEFSEKLKENGKQADALKKLKKEREKKIDDAENRLDFAQTKREAKDEELKEQQEIKKDALADMKMMYDKDPSLKNSTEYKLLEAKAAKAHENINGVLDGNGKIINSLRNDAKILRGEADKIKKEVKDIKEGDRDPTTGARRKVKVGEIKFDGNKATAEDVKRGVIRGSDLSLKQIEELMETNKKANAKAYLYSVARDSGAHVSPEYDKMGNIKDFHVDSKQAGEAQVVKGVARTMGRMAVSAAVGGALLGPLGAVAGGLAGLTGVIRDVATKRSFGRSFSDAEAAHATTHEAHAAHDSHEKHDNHGGGGMLSQIKAQFSTAFSSLGGGGGGGAKKSGGGGHGH